MRSILRPAFSASSRHRCSSFSNALSSTASFFNGWRSTPRHNTGNEPARQAHLDDRNQRAFRFEGGEGSTQVVQLLHGRSIGSQQRRWRQYPRRRPIASSIMGFEDEAEQSIGRPCRQTNGGSKRPSELTSSIVPRGTSCHHAVELEFPPIAFDPARFSCRHGFPGPAELGAVNPDAMHDHGQSTGPCCVRFGSVAGTSRKAQVTARSVSSRAEFGVCNRSDTAPTARTISACSM